ncbi:MAG: hypothetical protein JWO19_4038, partial [Bryobacterales bacterium]|nr:hypothetical protein [Bryobacterales bacterium]
SDDDHAAAWSLDTFTLELTAGLAPFIPSRALVLPFVPSATFEPVEVVEECGHDPPCVDRSIPRAGEPNAAAPALKQRVRELCLAPQGTTGSRSWKSFICSPLFGVEWAAWR